MLRLLPTPFLGIQSLHILFFNLVGIYSAYSVLSYISDGLSSNARTNCVTVQITKCQAAESQVCTSLTKHLVTGNDTSTSSQHIIYPLTSTLARCRPTCRFTAGHRPTKGFPNKIRYTYFVSQIRPTFKCTRYRIQSYNVCRSLPHRSNWRLNDAPKTLPSWRNGCERKDTSIKNQYNAGVLMPTVRGVGCTIQVVLQRNTQ